MLRRAPASPDPGQDYGLVNGWILCLVQLTDILIFALLYRSVTAVATEVNNHT